MYYLSKAEKKSKIENGLRTIRHRLFAQDAMKSSGRTKILKVSNM